MPDAPWFPTYGRQVDVTDVPALPPLVDTATAESSGPQMQNAAVPPSPKSYDSSNESLFRFLSSDDLAPFLVAGGKLQLVLKPVYVPEAVQARVAEQVMDEARSKRPNITFPDPNFTTVMHKRAIRDPAIMHYKRIFEELGGKLWTYAQRPSGELVVQAAEMDCEFRDCHLTLMACMEDNERPVRAASRRPFLLPSNATFSTTKEVLSSTSSTLYRTRSTRVSTTMNPTTIHMEVAMRARKFASSA